MKEEERKKRRRENRKFLLSGPTSVPVKLAGDERCFKIPTYYLTIHILFIFFFFSSFIMKANTTKWF